MEPGNSRSLATEDQSIRMACSNSLWLTGLSVQCFTIKLTGHKKCPSRSHCFWQCRRGFKRLVVRNYQRTLVEIPRPSDYIKHYPRAGLKNFFKFIKTFLSRWIAYLAYILNFNYHAKWQKKTGLGRSFATQPGDVMD